MGKFRRRFVGNVFSLCVAGMDLVILYACSYLAVQLRIQLSGTPIAFNNLSDIISVLPFMCVSGLLLLNAQGVYKRRERSLLDIGYAVFISVFLLAIITMAMSFLMRTFAYPRSVIIINSAMQMILLFVWHLTALYVSRAFYGKQLLLIIGRNPELKAVANRLHRSGMKQYSVKYLFDIEKDYKIMRKLINAVDNVFVCQNVTDREKQIIFSYCTICNTGMTVVPDLFEISIKNAQLRLFDETLVFQVRQLKLTWEQEAVKRLFDIVFSLAILVLTSPLLLLTALMVKLTSPGPAIFKQERVTKNNRVFFAYKFRTMRADAENDTDPVLAVRNDPRVTKIGAFLRATRWDEMPQFFNTLRGDMSVVGPRPERMFFIEQFKNELPEYEYRVAVKAGITGYAQLMGTYATSASDKLRFDLWYIKNYSLWLDISLILQTIKVLFIKGSVKGDEAEVDDVLNTRYLRPKNGYYEVGCEDEKWLMHG